MPNDGGPAFPLTPFYSNDVNGYDQVPEPGMTLRDYFAAHALAGLMASRHTDEEHTDRAMMAYAASDAMLAERSNESGGA